MSDKVEQFIMKLLPDEQLREICLRLLWESIKKANSCANNRWSLYYLTDRIRLVVGGFIVFTIYKGRIWLALDQQLLNAWGDHESILQPPIWIWDTGEEPDSYPRYKQIASRNGYYIPTLDNADVWDHVWVYHFEFIDKAANTYMKLNNNGQPNFSPDLFIFLCERFKENIPKPGHTIALANLLLEIEDEHATYESLAETEREALIQSRIGQGVFRNKLYKHWRGCAVTGCALSVVLRASHIKPWKDSNNQERLDKYNGFLLIPNLDIAFDSGLITFDNKGTIIISPYLDEDTKTILGIHNGLRINRIEKEHIKYLEYHRTYVFKKR